MILGLDIGRQFVKAVLLEKTRGGMKMEKNGQMGIKRGMKMVN